MPGVRAADTLRPVLFDALADPTNAVALRFGDRTLTYRQLRDAATAVAERVDGCERVATWAVNEPEVAVAVIGALLAGVPITPINPKAGSSELEHILDDSAPELVLTPPGVEPPVENRSKWISRRAASSDLPAEPPEDAPAIVVYTSGTTGPPKGAVLPRRALASNLDALAEAWEWTGDDVVAHALPLFHVHGLILGTLGPVRRGGGMHHIGRFSAAAAAGALADDATMLFAVPTMYHRLAAEAEQDAEIAKGFASARLLVSGSAALPAVDHERIEKLTGQRIVERYGMTETLMNTGVRASGERRPGYVGPPLRRRRACGWSATTGRRSRTPTTRRSARSTSAGPNLFLEYLNRPDATAEAITDGWFKTGDLATRAPDGYIRIVGRRATDLIKSGGFKIGAGEIEGALLEHPGVEGGRGDRRARPGPRRADRRVGGRGRGTVAERGRAGGPRRRPAHPAQAPARRPLHGRAAAQRDGQGPEEEAGSAMKVTGEHTFRLSRDQVWAGLQDPKILAAAVPGARRLHPTGPDEYEITVDVGVGSVKGTYEGTFALTDKQEGEACTVRASASGRPGSVEAVAQMRLAERDGGVLLTYEADATVTGPLAGVGQRLMGAAARRTTRAVPERAGDRRSCRRRRDSAAAAATRRERHAARRSSSPRRVAPTRAWSSAARWRGSCWP